MIIHAVSIHSGGGKVLLDQLLTKKEFGEITLLICDKRYKLPDGVDKNLKIIRIPPTLRDRWLAENKLKDFTDKNPGLTVLCFANLPPAFRLNAKVILYLQNALLLPQSKLYFSSLWAGLRLVYEKIWLTLFWKNLDEVWVQTEWMKTSLTPLKKKIIVKPILADFPSVSQTTTTKKFDFISITGSASHKRQYQLLDAWSLMPDPAPSLLFITDSIDLKYESLKSKNVTFRYNLSRQEIYQSYLESETLILTSKLESYCLPLHEAIYFKLNLICPDEAYVREVCKPDLIIDPENVHQMQKMIERFYKGKKQQKVPLKILNVNMTIDPVKSGGTGERTVQMSRALSAIGHDCSILTLNLGLTKARKEELAGIKLTALYCLSERFYIPVPRLGTISHLIKEAEVIHLMGHWTLLNAIAYYYIKKFKKKYIVCPAGALPIFGRSTGIKTIYNYFFGKKIIRNADSHFVITHAEIPQFQSYGVSTEKVVWVPNGIDPKALVAKDDQLFRQKFQLGDAPFIFYIGRLNPIKGPDLLVQAFCELKNEFPKFHLVMAGPDEGMLDSLSKMARDHQMDNRIHFIGHVGGELKSQALHAATLMAIPSRLEAMSIVVLEGGVVGLPVLLTNKCGLNELTKIEAGIVVPATVEGIKEGLRNHLNQPERLNVLGQNLKKHVYENYLWPSVAQKIEDNYLKIVNEI